MRIGLALARMLVLAGGCAASTGCAMPMDGVSADGNDASPLRFELEYGEDGRATGVRLVNDGVEELRFGSTSVGYQPNPRVFVEARQADGEFEGQGRWYMGARQGRLNNSSLPPGGVLSFPAGYGARDLRPGDYRISLEVYAGDDSARRVSRELGRTGWPVDVVDEAIALRAEAEQASCSGLARTIGNRLLQSADADGIDAMESATTDWAGRSEVHGEMLRRGGFASDLVDFVESAPFEEVDELVGSLARGGSDVQVPVQRAANTRLLESVSNLAAEVEPFLFESLAHMHDNWPEGAPEVLLRRLEQGDDEGYGLSALVRLFVSAQDDFDGVRPRVYAALRRRCDGVRGETLERVCELALIAYDPSGRGRVGFGGFSTSCRCGGAFSGGPQCDPLRERWEQLTAGAPALEDYALPSRVEDVVAQDDATHP